MSFVKLLKYYILSWYTYYRSDVSFYTEDVPSKVVNEVDVRRVANGIDNCRVYNTTLAQPSAVHNVFIDGKGSGYDTVYLRLGVWVLMEYEI